MAGGRGALGIRRLDVIDPNRPRGTPLAVRTDRRLWRTCVRARAATAYTARPHTVAAKQRFSLPSSALFGTAATFL